MSENTRNARNTRAVSLALLAATFAMAGAARADGGEYLLPVSMAAEATSLEHRDAEPATCAEASNAAWFLAEVQRTDGQVQPEMPAVRCEVERYAALTGDE